MLLTPGVPVNKNYYFLALLLSRVCRGDNTSWLLADQLKIYSRNPYQPGNEQKLDRYRENAM